MKNHKMTCSEFTSWYYEVGARAAMKMAICNGVSLAQTQIWRIRIESSLQHLILN